MACGAPLGSAAPAEQRRVVTIVFSDLVGSTALGERMDPEAYRGVLTRYFDVVRAALERHGGVLEKYIGDAVMAVFGLPRAHEDDALRGCRAVLDVQDALQDFNDRLEQTHGLRLALRTGVHTGEVVSGDPSSGQRLVTGDAVNTAARLEQACPEMAVLIGQPTYELVRHQVETEPFELINAKGKSAPLRAHRLIAVRGSVPVICSKASRSRLVGRESELHKLTDAWRSVSRDSRCRLMAVVGDAGMGKTRLVGELVSLVESEASVLRGGCLHYGEGITYWALASAFRSLVGLSDTDRGELLVERLCEQLDPAEHASVRRAAVGIGAIDGEIDTALSHAALVRVLAALARERPLLLVIDDVHWAESALLELLRGLPAELAEDRVLIVCGARRELLERPEWPPSPEISVLSFDQLSSRSVGELVRHTLGSEAAESLITAVDAAAGGNPLFVEQMLALWVERGVVRRDDAGWALAPGAATVVPPTVAAIVAARLDRLAQGDAAVARRASVVGQVFSSEAVEALSTPAEHDGVTLSLVRLSHARLVLGSGAVGRLAGWSFPHVLVRDAAYAGLLKRDRSALHERCADWITTLEASHELAEIAAYHCEQAYVYAAELAVPDQRVRRLQSRAVEELAESGRRALRRGALASASGWLERALAVADHADPRRAALLTDLGTALSELGERERARSVLGEAMALASAAGDVSARWRARRPLLEFDVSVAQMVAEAREHLALLGPLGDDAGLARAWRIIALAAWHRGQIRESLDATGVALSHALAAEEETEARDIRAALPALAMSGTMPVPEALQLTRATLAEVGDSFRARGFVLMSMAVLLLMDDDPRAARQAWTDAQTALREGGIKRWGVFLVRTLADIDIADGDLDVAVANLAACTADASLAAGVRGWIGAQLMHVLLDAGRHEEASAYGELVTQTDRNSPEDWTLAASALARLAAQQGDQESATRLIREAVDVLDGTDLLDLRASALERSAEVARTLGDGDTCITNLRRALELFDLKGDRRAAERLRAALP